MKNQGFTLLELLIYVTILSILVVVVSNTFITLSKGSGQSQAKSEVDSAIRFATELIRQDVMSASAITTPSSGSSSSTMTLTRTGSTIVYDVSSGVLRRKVDAGAPDNLTGSTITVSSPTFTRIENTNSFYSATNVEIRINMTFSYNSTSPDYKYSDSLQTSVAIY